MTQEEFDEYARTVREVVQGLFEELRINLGMYDAFTEERAERFTDAILGLSKDNVEDP